MTSLRLTVAALAMERAPEDALVKEELMMEDWVAVRWRREPVHEQST